VALKLQAIAEKKEKKKKISGGRVNFLRHPVGYCMCKPYTSEASSKCTKL